MQFCITYTTELEKTVRGTKKFNEYKKKHYVIMRLRRI